MHTHPTRLAATSPVATIAAMQRTLKVVPRTAQSKQDLAFWLSRPMAERIAAVETLRQDAFAANPGLDADARLQRVVTVVRRTRR
jgi:hypothetical protein